MGTVVLYILIAANAALALFRPWIGIVLAYLIAVLTPQNIWWWAFEGLRPLYTVLLPTLVGFGIAVLRGAVSFTPLNTKLNWCVAGLWLTSTIAYYFGPYVDVVNDYRFYDPAFMFSTWQKTCLTYFVAVTLIDNTQKLKVLAVVLVISVAYMTLWANEQYFVFGKYGRMGGPVGLDGSSIYADENNFAVLFVVGAPFLYYFGRYLNSPILTLPVWAIIPFSWHAVFLTASRGALLGIAATLAGFALRSEKRSVGVITIVLFAVAFVWQAGPVMKERSSTITAYETEDSAGHRLAAWKAAIGMMEAHPLTGVGFASFGQAFPDFSNIPPRIAHNTFFQVGGEWGVAAAFAYLLLMISTLNRLRINGRLLRAMAETEEGRVYLYVNEACLLSLIGFFTCSMFLSLEKYEVLYYLLVLANATLIGGAALYNRKGREAA
jgi:probable O-glycosylation ligase (exosortase A-associated)